MSGHSKWATIKHKKGGGDPGGNPRLRKAISDAKGQSMPNDTIKRAIQRGTGELEGVSYEDVLYEGTGPGGTLYVVETLTDNRNRTVAELRKIFEKHNGSLGAAGTAEGRSERRSADGCGGGRGC
jgi:transcriptional/translational regulatory protein YebC/TACO1